MLIDPESGWLYGFPKPAPEDFYKLGDDFNMQEWLESEGYPKGKVPHYVRFIGETLDE